MINKKIIIIITLSMALLLTALFLFYQYHPQAIKQVSFASYSIKKDGKRIEVHLQHKGKQDFALMADVFQENKRMFTNEWPLKYEVFRVDTGDVDNDRSTDILVGVIKPTRYDPIVRKRIFIFKLFEGYIRPLWMGSRVSQPLVDFKYFKSHKEGLVRTIESERNGSYLIAEYHWIGFGIGFIRYIAREKTLTEANQILNTVTYGNEN